MVDDASELRFENARYTKIDSVSSCLLCQSVEKGDGGASEGALGTLRTSHTPNVLMLSGADRGKGERRTIDS